MSQEKASVARNEELKAEETIKTGQYSVKLTNEIRESFSDDSAIMKEDVQFTENSRKNGGIIFLPVPKGQSRK